MSGGRDGGIPSSSYRLSHYSNSLGDLSFPALSKFPLIKSSNTNHLSSKTGMSRLCVVLLESNPSSKDYILIDQDLRSDFKNFEGRQLKDN